MSTHSIARFILRVCATAVVGATFIAWVWFGESPPVAAYPAAVLIAGGIVLVVSAGRAPSAAVD